MKKYSESIEVMGENIKALFDCPIVTDIKKATDAASDGLDVGDMLAQVIVLTMQGTHVQVKRGNVLAKDICGHWEVMTADEWDSHKDDTIDVPTDSGTAETPSTDSDKGNGDGTSSGGGTDGDGSLLD